MCTVEEDSHTVTWEDECAADQDASLAHLNCPPRITAPPCPAPGSVQCLYSNKHFHKHHYVHTLTHMLTTQQLRGLGKCYSEYNIPASALSIGNPIVTKTLRSEKIPKEY